MASGWLLNLVLSAFGKLQILFPHSSKRFVQGSLQPFYLFPVKSEIYPAMVSEHAITSATPALKLFCSLIHAAARP
jgi:hypothetical protein